MAGQRKEFISDKTLLTWIMVCGITTIASLLVAAVIVFLIYDCWIMYQHQLAGGTCSPDLNQPLVFSIIIAMGLILGTLLTRKITKADNSSNH